MGLSLEQALALQDDLIDAYRQDDVQGRLRAILNQAKGDKKVATEMKQTFLMELQKPIVSKYGFEASARGVQEAMDAFSPSHIHLDPDVYKKNNWMESLLSAGQPLDWYMTTPQLWEVRNLGHFRPLPQDRFPMVEYQDWKLSEDCRIEAVPRGDMLPAKETQELVGACKSANVSRVGHLLGIRKVGASTRSVVLNLGYNVLGPKPMKTLAQALKQADQLEVLELDVSGNNIGPEGAKALVLGLQDSLRVLKLNMANNRLTLAGVKAIAEGLPSSLEVLHLGFAGMKMGPEGAVAIAASLPPRLKDLALDLHGNGIGDEGVATISRALPTTIERLNVVLLGNNLSRRGFYAFDRQVGDPLHEHHLPKLRNEDFKKAAEVELEEFRTEPDGRLVRQLDWRSNF